MLTKIQYNEAKNRVLDYFKKLGSHSQQMKWKMLTEVTLILD